MQTVSGALSSLGMFRVEGGGIDMFRGGVFWAWRVHDFRVHGITGFGMSRAALNRVEVPTVNIAWGRVLLFAWWQKGWHSG